LGSRGQAVFRKKLLRFAASFSTRAVIAPINSAGAFMRAILRSVVRHSIEDATTETNDMPISLQSQVDQQGRLPLPGPMEVRGLYSVIVAPRSGGGVWLVTKAGERDLPLPIRVISRRVAVDKDGAIRVPDEMHAWKGKTVQIRQDRPGMWIAEKL